MGGIAQRIPRGAALLVVAAAALPRLLALAVEREQILEAYVEKSDVFARTLVESGTFGFLPGVPSAYTQPLYAWFLAGLYWPLDRSWAVVGLAQVLVAGVTALFVLAIGTHLASVRTGVLAALVATLHPYLVWHDIHVNREILDGLLAAVIVLLALLAYERRSLALALGLGAVSGLAILSNARLLLLPLVLAPYVAWRVRPVGRAIAAAALVVVGAALVTAPWVVRNKVVIGCATITTDTRALWKANNPATYDVLARGGWIDDVPDLRGVPPWPEKAAAISVAEAKAVDECAQSSFYRDEVFDFWRDHPGEKARLAVQAVGMLWSPFLSVTADDAAQQGASDLAQRTVEPAFVLLLYAFALWGAFLAPRRFVALAALLLGFNTLMAMVFAGTVRYRAPWDFVLALLAAFALERAWELLLRKRRSRPAASAVP
ncbi:MAG TPA: glycosyltransferase family 39 protein [Gaiella sp.]|nr:glycosyltransferase family 39 protein [Gaiella sp.]